MKSAWVRLREQGPHHGSQSEGGRKATFEDRASVLECGDLSPLFAGDTPSVHARQYNGAEAVATFSPAAGMYFHGSGEPCHVARVSDP